MATPDRHERPQWRPSAAFYAWLAPGLGHWALGQRHRAIILAVAIGVLWLAGLLIGGVGAIDAQQHRAWFVGQAMTAPSIAVNYVTQKIKAAQHENVLAGKREIYQPSFARVNDQGVLFTALAGLLNLLAVVDVAYRPTRRPPGAGAERP